MGVLHDILALNKWQKTHLNLPSRIFGGVIYDVCFRTVFVVDVSIFFFRLPIFANSELFDDFFKNFQNFSLKN
jgi:hypothetical protein